MPTIPVPAAVVKPATIDVFPLAFSSERDRIEEAARDLFDEMLDAMSDDELEAMAGEAAYSSTVASGCLLW